MLASACVNKNPVHSFFQTPGSAAPLFLRLTLSVIFFYHSARKLLGWFDGEGLTATINAMTEAEGLGLSALLAATAIVAEVFVVPLLFFGLLTRFAALLVVSLMAGALYIVHAGGPFIELQLPLTILACGLSLLFSGAGRFSLDRSISRALLPDIGVNGYRPLSF